MIFGAENNLSLYVDNRTKDVLVLGEGPTGGLADNTVTAKARYSVNTTKFRKKTCLSLHCNATNSFLYDNGVKIQQFQAKDSEMNPYLLYLGKFLIQ